MNVKVVNGTYYNTDDIVALVEFVRTNLANQLLQKHPELAGTKRRIHRDGITTDTHALDFDRMINEIHVKIITGEALTNVKLEATGDYVGDRVTRLIIGIKRRTEITNSDLETIALLSAENPTVPDNVILELITNIARECYSESAIIANLKGHNYYDRHSRSKAFANLIAQFPSGLTVRMSPRAAKGTRKEARRVLLEDRIRRRSSSLASRQRDLEELAKKVAHTESKARAIQEMIYADMKELRLVDGGEE